MPSFLSPQPTVSDHWRKNPVCRKVLRMHLLSKLLTSRAHITNLENVFCCGFSVGGSVPVLLAYYSEFQPKARRGAMVSLLSVCWLIGSVLAAGALCVGCVTKLLKYQPKSASFHIRLQWLFRSTSKSRPNNIRGGKMSVRTSVCPYVRTSVHKKFLRFQWNLVYR